MLQKEIFEMANDFDAKDTPFCDQHSIYPTESYSFNKVVKLEDAISLERKARLAEYNYNRLKNFVVEVAEIFESAGQAKTSKIILERIEK
jgi:hypothetical protein